MSHNVTEPPRRIIRELPRRFARSPGVGSSAERTFCYSTHEALLHQAFVATILLPTAALIPYFPSVCPTRKIQKMKILHPRVRRKRIRGATVGEQKRVTGICHHEQDIDYRLGNQS